jgi:hypothetical protein
LSPVSAITFLSLIRFSSSMKEGASSRIEEADLIQREGGGEAAHRAFPQSHKATMSAAGVRETSSQSGAARDSGPAGMVMLRWSFLAGWGRVTLDAPCVTPPGEVYAAPQLYPARRYKYLDDTICPPFSKGKVLPGSTDVGDASWITPTAYSITCCEAVGTAAHSWQMTAAAGMSIGHQRLPRRRSEEPAYRP